MSGVTTNTARRVRRVATLPAACSPGEVVMKVSGGSEGLYVCITANSWSGPLDSTSDTGDVVGPASSTDNAVARYDGAGGKTIQNSVVTITDAGTVNIPAGQTYNINGVPVGANPAGSDTQVQFNDGGAFGGDAGMVYNKTTNALTVAGPIAATGVTGNIDSEARLSVGISFLSLEGGETRWANDRSFGFSSSNVTFAGANNVAFSSGGAGIMALGTGAVGSKAGRLAYTTGILEPLTVATLPAGAAGMYAYVTDGDAGLAWGATVVNTGAGATKYLVWHNGTDYTVVGK